MAQSDRVFQFALVSDTHIGSPTGSEDLRRVVDDINQNPGVDLVIVTGDITEFGSDAELLEAKSILDQLNRPWYLIPGNHDTKWSESGNNSFRQIFGYERFYVDYKGYAFIGCSSGPNMRMAPGLVPAEDLVWLDSILAHRPDPKQPVLFFNHYPLDPGLANWYKVIDNLKRFNIQAVFCGHGHANRAFDVEGIPATMGRSSLRARADVGGYNLVTLERDTLFFEERRPQQSTLPPWRRIPLKAYDFQQQDKAFERPSFAINDQYPGIRPKWRIQDACDVGAGISIHKNLAVYANTCGQVKGLNATTGQLKWQFSAKGKIYSTPCIAGGRIIVASADSNIYCLKASTGTLIWTVKTGKAIVASPVVADGKVYLGSSEGKFRALSLRDGALLWENNSIDGFVETRPALDDKHVYFGSWGTYFYALNRVDGSLAWRWSNGNANRMYSPAAVFPVVSGDKVFIVAPDRLVTALDANTGRQVWRSDRKFGREALGLSEDGQTLYVKSMADTLFALNAAGGAMQLKWQALCGFGYDIAPSPVVEKAGTVYIPTDKGIVLALNPRDQTIQWGHKLSNALVNNVVPTKKGGLLGTTMDGIVFRLATKLPEKGADK